jgi:hypothetical protein
MIESTLFSIFQLISILLGLITFNKASPIYLRLFPFFLLIIFIVEISGELLAQKGISNVPLYNISSVFEFVFLGFFFSQVIKGERSKNYIQITTAILLIICLSNILLFQGIQKFHTYTYAIGSIYLVLLGVLYLKQLMNLGNTRNLLFESSFWITIGVIFFYLSTLTVAGTMNYLSTLPKIILYNIQAMILTLNCIYYSTFIIAFLCTLKKPALLSKK